MSCKNAATLATALAVCGMCADNPAHRRFVLADRVESTRCAPGKVVQVRLDSVPEIDSRGRKAHVRGFMLEANVNITIPDGTSDAVTAYQLRSIWTAMSLKDFTGHYYFNAIDGRVLLDDTWFRFWRHLPQTWFDGSNGGDQSAMLQFGVQAKIRPTITDNGIVTNIGAGAIQRNVSMYYPMARPLGVEGSPYEGLVPLKAITKAGADAFKFQVASAFAGSPADVPIGTLECEGGTAGMNVWLDVVYLDGYVLDAPWNVDSYTMSERAGVLNNKERTTEYAWIRYFPEDDAAFAGQTSLTAGYGPVTLSAGGTSEVEGYTLLEMVKRTLLEEGTNVDGGWATQNAALVLPIVVSGGATAIMLYGIRRRDIAPAGPINFKYATRTATFTRYTHRTVACLTDDDRAKKLASALDCDPCRVVPVDAGGNPTADDKPRRNGAALVFPRRDTRVRAY